MILVKGIDVKGVTIRKIAIQPEVTAAVSRMTVPPSSTDIENYNEWVRDIKLACNCQLGVHSLNQKFQILLLNASHDSQAAIVNFAQPNNTFDGTIIGTVNFLPYRGTRPDLTANDGYIWWNQAVMIEGYRDNGVYGMYKYTDDYNVFSGSAQTNGNANMYLQSRPIAYRFGSVGSQAYALPLGSPGVIATKRLGSSVHFYYKGALMNSATPTLLGSVVSTNGLAFHAVQRLTDVVVSGSQQDFISCCFYGHGSIDTGAINDATKRFLDKY